MKKITISILFLAAICLGTTLSAQSISLKGSNGKEVAFAGLKDATPKGITAQMKEDGPIIGIPWSKLDLKSLEENQPKIYGAYVASQKGETVPLNLGSYEDPGMKAAAETAESKRRKDGWYESGSRGVTYMVQIPVGKPRGVLIVAYGDRGDAYRFIMGMDQGMGPFGEFQNKHGFALMTYKFETKMKVPTDIDDFVFPEKGSGEGVISALEKIAKTANKPELADAPIAIYGMDKIGAAFAYNFTQWKPERVVAAVAGKGAFYTAIPTEESAKVPLLILWGQYDRSSEMWGSEHNHEYLYKEYADLNPNWSYAMEFRGTEEDSQQADYFARKYLHKLIEMRVPKVAPKPEAPPPSEEEKEAKPAAEGQEGEAEPEPEPEVPALIPIDRSESYIGNIETMEYSKMKKDAVLGENETWLPERGIAEMWKRFANGELEVEE